jgi:AcrR family transcriptional regulator
MGGSRRRAGDESNGKTSSERGTRSRRARYPKLKPGPGRSAEDVAEHQRGRLQAAMTELVAEGGYAAVTVAKLTERAGVSKRDFYRHFSGKEDCFLATYDVIVRNSLRGILAASSGQEEWSERLRTGFQAFAGQLVRSPAAARLALVDVFAAGPEAVARMLRTHGLFEALVAKNFALADGGGQLPPLVVKGIVAGGARTARARLLAGDAAQLSLDGKELMDWALCFCDDSVVGLPSLGVDRPAPSGTTPQMENLPRAHDERTLILVATARLMLREGYESLTEASIRAAAGVSRRSFEAHFGSVAECFLAMVDLLGSRALEAAAPAYLSTDDWPTGVHRMIAHLCEQLAAEPVLARLAFQEIFVPGAAAVGWRAAFHARLANLLHRSADPAERPSEFAAEASIGAIWGVIHYHVATGHTARLPLVSPTLSYLALAPAVGPEAAIDAIAGAVALS